MPAVKLEHEAFAAVPGRHPCALGEVRHPRCRDRPPDRPRRPSRASRCGSETGRHVFYPPRLLRPRAEAMSLILGQRVVTAVAGTRGRIVDFDEKPPHLVRVQLDEDGRVHGYPAQILKPLEEEEPDVTEPSTELELPCREGRVRARPAPRQSLRRLGLLERRQLSVASALVKIEAGPRARVAGDHGDVGDQRDPRTARHRLRRPRRPGQVERPLRLPGRRAQRRALRDPLLRPRHNRSASPRSRSPTPSGPGSTNATPSTTSTPATCCSPGPCRTGSPGSAPT